MFKGIIHYLKVYKEFAVTSTAVKLSFRTSFILLFVMDLSFLFSSIYSVDFIYDHISTINGWSKDQMLFFLSYMIVLDTLAMVFVTENFWMFSYSLRTGEFDFLLLRPIHSAFSVFFRRFRVTGFLNMPFALYFLMKYGRNLQFEWFQWALLPLLLLLSFALLILIQFNISTLMFWMIEGNGINFLRLQIQRLGKFPDVVYSQLSRKIFTYAFPILMVGTFPNKVLFNFDNFSLLFIMIAAVGALFLVFLTIWNLGLKSYDSASS